MDDAPFFALLSRLARVGVRYVVIGVSAVNYYARTSAEIFSTQDRDLFMPPDPDNLVRAWAACRAEDFALWAGNEPLDEPSDRWLAERMVARRALTTATRDPAIVVDLTLVMADFDFESVWNNRRIFTVEGVEIPVASMADIVESKARAGRPKDRLFLATYDERLRQLLDRDRNE
jgi:hypothetical protein